MKYLIVGLGNIGPEYKDTRHNIGFRIVEDLASKANTSFVDARYAAFAKVCVKNKELVLIKPSTFMNLSGNAVRYWMSQEKIPIERVLVLVDDLALPFGTLRMKPSGGDAGHNGLKNIATLLGSNKYARLRFGLGSEFSRGSQVDFVLSPFSSEEESAMQPLVDRASEMVKSFCLSGIQFTMNQFNS